MANLRTSTSNEKVRDYHKEFYRPENLCLVITGQVDHEAVFKVLEPFEEKIEKKVRTWKIRTCIVNPKCFYAHIHYVY